jgi:hypothetical protein
MSNVKGLISKKNTKIVQKSILKALSIDAEEDNIEIIDMTSELQGEICNLTISYKLIPSPCKNSGIF